jgi:N-acetyl-anhydromuramyl-L-alanine amidase AmpD
MRSDNGPVRFYPYAQLRNDLIENGEGAFEGQTAKGITVHYTAGGTATSTIDYLRKTALRYHLLIDREGSVYQLVYLDRKVNHAGPSDWLGLSPNRTHLSVALANWGTLEKEGDRYLTWARKALPSDQVAHRRFTRTGELGYWEACTPEQEAALYSVIEWLCVNCNIDSKNICGHDEATTRKVDPGGSLSFTIGQLRRTVYEAS